jgi:hypothetical protein
MLLLAATQPLIANAKSCSKEIERLQRADRLTKSDPAAGPSAAQSMGAQLGHQSAGPFGGRTELPSNDLKPAASAPWRRGGLSHLDDHLRVNMRLTAGGVRELHWHQTSLQGLGPDGCEFVMCFDDGSASEFNTLLVTDWFAHTPHSVLAENFGEPVILSTSRIPTYTRRALQLVREHPRSNSSFAGVAGRRIVR